MPRASIVVPAFNSAKSLPETLDSLLAQTFDDFEIVIVDDGSTDATFAIGMSYSTDPRVRVIQQANRGLAGARNTGILRSSGDYVGFCDADDLWAPGKLAAHVAHLDRAPDVGLSFTGSALIDEASRPLGLSQRPRLTGITAAHVFQRNPVGNGSAAVMRRAALDDLSYLPTFSGARRWVFDETFRQSEDIECWLRLALATDWQIEGIPGAQTLYRINGGGLSANTDRQFAAWERVVQKLRLLNPEFFERHEPAARAYQLRYLARRAVSAMDGDAAWDLACQSLAQSRQPLISEPLKTSVTVLAAATLKVFGPGPLRQATRLLSHSSKN